MGKKHEEAPLKAHELTVQDRERQKIISKLAEGRPMDEVILVENVKSRLTRTVHDLVEAGKELVLLQEIWGRGNFVYKVEKELKIPHSSAYRLMNAAIKSINYPVINQISQVGKIYALIEAPHEELQKFEETGFFAGKSADELELLPKSELIQIVRSMKTEKKEKKDAQGRLIDKLNKEVERLKKESETAKLGLPDDEEAMEKALQVELLKFDGVVAMLGTVDGTSLSPRMLTKYIGALEYINKYSLLEMLKAKQEYGDPSEQIFDGDIDEAEAMRVGGGWER